VKVVFIAAPFRADTAFAIAENVRRAERAALAVWRLGMVAVCPQANSALFHGAAPDAVFLNGYRALLGRCDAVLVAGDHSSGVLAELERAADLGIPIFDDLDKLREWSLPTRGVEATS
jgi:hypothetical protein